MSTLADDPRFRVLYASLASDGTVSDEAPDPAVDRMEAAVALVVRATESLELLLIKRATHEADPWSGHMALPGGRWEPNDSGLLHTAKRETLEETGIDLERHGAPLGRLVDVAPMSARLPPMRIAPFVFGVPAHVEGAVMNHELESLHWVPIDQLRSPEASTTVRVHFSGFSKKFPSYSVAEEHVWGLTHRILTDFLDRFPI
ncbi:MAG: CoA pyrophosphatase [Gemmatimonadota bacterium]|nr:CoA pyrophosphatase [Gemmatimonadota bacterium]